MIRGSGHHPPERFWAALRGVWFSPRRFFGRLDPRGGPLRPAVFAALVFYLVLLLEEGLQAAWNWEFGPNLVYVPLLGLAVAAVLGPLLVAGFAALVLVVLDGAPSRTRFGPVFRHLGYASGVLIVLWIPYGPLLALAYGPYVATVAVKEALNLDWRRAAAGVLIPLTAMLLVLAILAGFDEVSQLLLNPPQS